MNWLIYRASEEAMYLCHRASRYVPWLYSTSCWAADVHVRAALRGGYWKINPAWSPGSDEPKYIDAGSESK